MTSYGATTNTAPPCTPIKRRVFCLYIRLLTRASKFTRTIFINISRKWEKNGNKKAQNRRKEIYVCCNWSIAVLQHGIFLPFCKVYLLFNERNMYFFMYICWYKHLGCCETWAKRIVRSKVYTILSSFLAFHSLYKHAKSFNISYIFVCASLTATNAYS